MILVDANLLIYAHSTSMPQHQAARVWLDGQLNGHGPVGLPWPSLLSFLRILSNPRAVPKPSPVAHLWRQVREWLAVENVWIPSPHEHHAEIFSTLIPLGAGSTLHGCDTFAGRDRLQSRRPHRESRGRSPRRGVEAVVPTACLSTGPWHKGLYN